MRFSFCSIFLAITILLDNALSVCTQRGALALASLLLQGLDLDGELVLALCWESWRLGG